MPARTFAIVEDLPSYTWSLKIALFLLSVMPCVYVWLLPLLATQGVTQNYCWNVPYSDLGSFGCTFAHKCEDFPHCTDSYIGLSVSSLISTPQATGAMSAVWFFPLFHLWSLKGRFEVDACAFLLTLGIFVFTALALASPVTTYPVRNDVATFLLTVCITFRYVVLLRTFRHQSLFVSKITLVIIVVCATGAILLTLIALLASCMSQPYIILHSVPWLFFILQAGALSGTSLFPYVFELESRRNELDLPMPKRGITDSIWSRDVRNSFRLEMPVPERSVTEGPPNRPTALRAILQSFGTRRIASWSTIQDLQEHGFLQRTLQFVAALPFAYVWVLPLLAQEPFNFAHKCNGWPACKGSVLGMSVSDLIANPQATGLMAGLFFWPLAHLWSHKADVGCGGTGLLLAFYFFFGCFLSAPITVYPNIHMIVVGLFCICALLWYYNLLQYCSSSRLWKCKVLLRISVFSFSGVLLTVTIAMIAYSNGRHLLVRDYVPYLFYAFEAAGLSCMSVFPWFWMRGQEGY